MATTISTAHAPAHVPTMAAAVAITDAAAVITTTMSSTMYTTSLAAATPASIVPTTSISTLLTSTPYMSSSIFMQMTSLFYVLHLAHLHPTQKRQISENEHPRIVVN